MVRTYLDWILDLPWTKASEDNLDFGAVRATLEADHYGLEKVKRRILEFLAVRKLKADKKGPILCSWPPRRRQDVAGPRASRGHWPQVRAASHWAACTTRRPSVVTGERTSARSRARSSRA